MLQTQMRSYFSTLYNFGREVTFKIHVIIIATSNTPLSIIMKIYLTTSNVFDATYRPCHDLHTNIYGIKPLLNENTKNTEQLENSHNKNQ